MSKKLLVLMSVLMMMVPFANVNAQGLAEGIDYCEILPEADCQILVQSDAVMADVSSLAFDMSIAYNMSMDEMGMDNLNFAIDGNGAVAFDSELFAQMNEMAMGDMAAYMEALPALIDEMLASFEGEMSLNVTLPDMMAMMMDGMSTEIPLNLVMENGVYALDVATLTEAIGEDAGGMTWVGIDLNGAYQSMMGDMGLDMLFDADMMDSMTEMNDADFTSAITINRLPDSSLNGQSVAVFELLFDYGTLLEVMGMDGMLNEMYTDMGMSQEEIDAALSILEGLEFDMRQYVGLDDFYTYRVEFAMDFELDGEAMGEPEMGTVAFDFSMTFDMNEFNVPVDVAIPEDAQIFPFEMLMGGGL